MSIAYKSPTCLLHWPVLFAWAFFFFLKDTRGHYLWAARKEILCLVPLQIPTLITQNPTDLPWSCPWLKNCAEPEGSLGGNQLMPFLTNYFGYLDIVRLSNGIEQISKLFWRSTVDCHPECLGWLTVRLWLYIFTEFLILTCLVEKGRHQNEFTFTTLCI